MHPGIGVGCEDVATDGWTNSKPCHRTQDGEKTLHGLKPEIRRDLAKKTWADDAARTLGADDSCASHPSGRVGLQEVCIAMLEHALCNGVVFAAKPASEVIDRAHIDLIGQRRELSKDNHAVMENIDERSLVATCKGESPERRKPGIHADRRSIDSAKGETRLRLHKDNGGIGMDPSNACIAAL